MLPQRVALLSSTAGWTPRNLGASLLAWWDAERTDLITLQTGSAVSSWKDVVGAYDATQGTGSARPTWASGWVSADGLDDQLTGTYPGTFPSGATPVMEWFTCDQTALVADTTSRVIGSSGGSAAVSASRQASRLVAGGANRASASAGNGSTSDTATETTVDFSGRHVVCVTLTGSQIVVEIDGVAAAPVSNVPSIGTTRLRMFANTSNTPGGFWQGRQKDRLVTTVVDASTKARMLGFLNQRKNR
jgi:hypothetical protein